jgi:glyoxylase-like metal-dependent hydrolase (beta-lactamase superfamily II)
MSAQKEKKLALHTFPVGTLGCNCSILYSPQTREAIAIDPGNDADAFLSQVVKLNVQVKALLHTHAHYDHIGQADTVRKKIGSPLYLHKGDLFLYEALQQQARYFGEVVSAPEGIDHFIQDEEEFTLSLVESSLQDPQLRNVLKSIHTPGHTPGSCSFYCEMFETPMLFSGDTLFANSIGRTDLPGGNFDQILSSIKTRILTLDPETVVIPGHGVSTVLHHEKRYNRFLK